MDDDDRYEPGSFFRTHKVRLVGSDGAQLGVVTLAEAMRRASDAGLKLVEIDTMVEPLVCKLMDAEQYERYLADRPHLRN